MVISNKYQHPSPLIATYNATDIATGIGRAIYYLMRDLDANEFLSASRNYSTNGSQTNASAIDLDFDVTILKTIIIDGDAIVSIPIDDNSGANPHTPTMTILIRKWDGTTETLIGSNSGSDTIQPGEFNVWTLKIPCTRTKIGVGEVLRVTVQLTIRGSAFEEANILFDPSDLLATGAILTSTAIADIPVKIDF